MSILTEDEIRANAFALRSEAPTGYKYIEPPGAPAQRLLDTLQNVDGRFMLGLADIDVLTRGFGKGELALIVGFAHSGKTQLVNNMILNNKDKRILFFSLDDPAEMILAKLACLQAQMPAEELEHFARNDPTEAAAWLQKMVADEFANLLVPDRNLSIDRMHEAIKEAHDYWGAFPDAVVIDYLTLIPNGDDAADYSHVKSKSEAVKRWVKEVDAPVIVLHQSNRSSGGPGEVQTMLSAAYGGEQEGTFMIGVRRKIFDTNLTPGEQEQHEKTITLHLVKNKRPPGRLTKKDGIDFYLDPDTGYIRPWQSADAVPKSGAAAVAREQEQRRRISEVPLPYKDG